MILLEKKMPNILKESVMATPMMMKMMTMITLPAGESPRSSSGAGSAQPKSPNDTPVLDNFGTDMTRAAAENRLDPIVGREKEIERLAQILSRRKRTILS